MELLIFMNWNFKTNHEHKPLSLVLESNVSRIFMLTKNRKKRSRDSSSPIKGVQNILFDSSYDSYITFRRTFEVSKFNVSLTEEIQRSMYKDL